MSKKKVFVSGCFDMLHSGHVRFLEQAARYGDVYVGIGSDQTVKDLKGRFPVTTERERQYVIGALKHVKACFINRGSGIMDFTEELRKVRPEFLVVNEEGNTDAKRELCEQLGIRYVVLQRTPHPELPARSTTSLRKECRIPYRIDLAGGWLDQPFVSRHVSGPVLTISVEPLFEFNDRSGMASSTRRRAIELWQTEIPPGPREKLARVLFCTDNPPGTKEFSGSQDAIGIVYPGLNRLDYAGDYWPAKITSVHDEGTLRWLEDHLRLVSLGPRPANFHVLSDKRITAPKARRLAAAADQCWHAILKQDLTGVGNAFRQSFEAQIQMFPGMTNKEVQQTIKRYASVAAGWKISGAGGGGYLILVGKCELPEALRIKIRRNLP